MVGRPNWLEKIKVPDVGAVAKSIGWLEKLKPDSDTTMGKSIEWLENFVTPEAGRAERRAVEHFAAYRWNGSALEQDTVKDISATGVYLVTKERWRLGTTVWLTLQKEGSVELDRTRRITTRAKVTRSGADGVALTFISSKDDPRSLRWESLLENVIALTKPVDMLGFVRMVESFAFLSRLCPDGAEEIEEWIRARASNHKLANAVGIALKTENLFVLGPTTVGKGRVNPQVALRVLEYGSSTDEDWLHDFWAGLLFSSCSADGSDQSSLEFVELFSQLTVMPLRIFTVVCTRSTKVISESGVSAKPLACNLAELAATVGSRGLQTERDLDSLVALRLIEKRVTNTATLLTRDEAFITPTSFGLRLFALCKGHRGPLRDFYA